GRGRAFPLQQRARYPPGGTAGAARAAGRSGHAGAAAAAGDGRAGVRSGTGAMTRNKDDNRPRRRGWGRLALLLVVLGAGLVAYQLWQDYARFRDLPLSIGVDERIMEIERGDSFRDVLAKIRGIGIEAGHDLEWELL